MSKLEVDAIEPQSGTTLTLGASGDTITIPSGATFTSTGIDDNATSTAITIDSSENIGIGTSSPTALLELFKAGTTQLKTHTVQQNTVYLEELVEIIIGVRMKVVLI